MLSDNTNKIVWISVAVGIVSLFGVVTLTMFPSLLNSVKSEARLTSLVFAETGDNLLYAKDDDLKASDFGTAVQGNDYATISDVSKGVVNIELGKTKGHVYGAFLKHSYNNYDGIAENDKWKISADIKTDNTDVSFYNPGADYTALGIEGSKAQWTEKPALSDDWQHYEASGVRTSNFWGSVIIYFTSTSDKPVNIQVENLKLERVR